MLNFLSNLETHQLSPLNMRENMYKSKQKYWYIYDLVDALNNYTKFHVLSVKVKENVTTVCRLHQKQKLKTPL